MIPTGKGAMTVVTVLSLGACSSGVTLEPSNINLAAVSESGLAFAPVEPFAVDAEYVWHGGEEYGFVANLATREIPRCYDILPATEEVRAALERIEDYPDVLYDPEPPPIARFRLTVDAIAEVPQSRASYLRWPGEDQAVLSSAPWYRLDGEQIFMNCTEIRSAFRVYRVAAVDSL